MEKRNRTPFPAIRDYQAHLMLLIFIPAVIMHLCLFGMLSLMHLNLFGLIVSNPSLGTIGAAIDSWSVRLLVMSGGLIAVYLIVAFFVSRNLLGAFSRIINDLDKVISGEKKGPLSARKYDGLANEVLKRINTLIVKDAE